MYERTRSEVTRRGCGRLFDWFGWMADSVLSLGYVGVFLALVLEGLGLPFPGDVAMAFYGFAAARGDVHLGAVMGCSLVGYMTGSTIAYTVSRKFGGHWLDTMSHRMLLNQRSIMSTSGLIRRYGAWLLIPGRFLPGVRSVSSYVAGISRMDFQAFLLYTGIGAALWCAGWVALGFWCGEHLTAVLHGVQSSLAYVLAGVLVALVGFLWYRRKAR
jgi:membrane protein DedA with SNARE-associated domain